jgi:DNA-binding CsgD family transcriptional regulator
MNHRLADKPRVGPDDLRGEVLILGPREADPSVSDGLAAGLDNAGYRFRDLRNTKGDSPRDAMFLVAEGTGITVATLAALNGSGDLTALVTHRPLDPPLQMPATVIAWRTDPPDQLRPLVEAAREAARAVAGRRRPVAAAPLTPRELEVIRLAAAGHSARDIAERLVVGHSTVRTHFENIYAKLSVSDKASAVATALRRGLID